MDSGPESKPHLAAHPRLTHFPFHPDYQLLASEYRPFVLYTHDANYRSPSVNTDALGLREQYSADGDFIDIRSARDAHPSCNILLGGSTAFGVDASSDKHTVSAHLQQKDRPFINLGVRAATARQELLIFLVLKDLLPPVRNIVLLSGANEVSLAALDPEIDHLEFGATFAYTVLYAYRRYFESGAPTRRTKRSLILDHAKSVLRKSRGLTAAPDVAMTNAEESRSYVDLTDYELRLNPLLEKLNSDLETWSALQGQFGLRVHYVLQPVIGWHSRRLTAVERACFEADLDLIPSMRRYTNMDVYEIFATKVRQTCGNVGIEFHDSNQWFESSHEDTTIFSDVCHLTDAGYELLAKKLRDNLKWVE